LNPQSQAQGASTQGLGRGPFRLAVALVCWTIVVILKGAMVTSTGSGMAYRDWPKADGQWLPESSYTTLPGFFEHFHRIAGAIAGLLSLTLVVHLWRCKALSSPGGRVAVLGLALIIVQGVVGGVGVLNTERAMAAAAAAAAQGAISLRSHRRSRQPATRPFRPSPSALCRAQRRRKTGSCCCR
jgi:heme A synthase